MTRKLLVYLLFYTGHVISKGLDLFPFMYRTYNWLMLKSEALDTENYIWERVDDKN